jgi:trk system potassium uptake protein TrkA
MAEKIVLVDPDPIHAKNAADTLFKTQVLEGDCTYIEVLQDIGVDDASFFISAGHDAEDNIMAALLAKSEGAKEVIAVTDNERHTHIFRNLGIDHLINPKGITMQKIIASIFKLPIGSLVKFRNADIGISRFIANKKSKIVNTPLHEIAGLTRKSLIVGCIFRNESVIIPSGNTVILEDDEVLIISKKEDLKIAEKYFKSGISIEF